ncbi:MAG: 16S rRNA (adenine(1518)-N(6)/adenine(1519)-N(6))-dimethyltransferase RsmA [Candidatus Omnitrophota bacterium]
MELTQLKQLWQAHDFRPKKRMGQNFLIDKNVRDKIIGALCLTKESTVIEVGPGFGVMSLELADKCEKLFAVEKDKRICEIMAPIFESRKNITFFCDDILNVDFSAVTHNCENLIIFGNIPYYISTPLMVKVIEARKYVKSVFIVIQDDLARRITANPGSKTYGSISCFIQFYTSCKRLFTITNNCFYPRPQVESCLLKLEILPHGSVEVQDEELLFKIIRKAFSQRRKKVINSLSDKDFLSLNKAKWEDILKKCKINPSTRAENLSLQDYATLTNCYL